MAVQRASWLEPHDRFEGVGAHELNPRYDHVDGGGYDEALTISRRTTPALVKAQRRLTLTRPLVRLLGLAPQLDGIDIAHYQWDQGPVDLTAVHAIPTFWFATKAAQSTSYVDPTFAKARSEAHAAGFTQIGLYHWLSSTKDPVAQADHFLATIGTLQPGEFVMGDFEEAGITAAGCLAFNERVESRTRRPVVGYSGLYVAGGTIWRSIPLRTSQWGPRPFIVAAYVTEANLRARLAATHSPDPDAWQYSSNGPVPGIVGRCDMDMVFDRPVFDLASGNTATPMPQPQPPLPEDDDMKLATNEEPRQMPWGLSQPGAEIFLIGTRKRSVSPEEYKDLYGNAPAAALTNAVLDSIPDELTEDGGGAVDTVARNLITKVNDLVGDTRAKLRTAGGG